MQLFSIINSKLQSFCNSCCIISSKLRINERKTKYMVRCNNYLFTKFLGSNLSIAINNVKLECVDQIFSIGYR